MKLLQTKAHNHHIIVTERVIEKKNEEVIKNKKEIE